MQKSNEFPCADIQACFEKLLKSIPLAQKVAFGATFLGGIFIHITPISNLLWNWDSSVGTIYARASNDFLILQGKWLTPKLLYLEGLGNDYMIPFKIFVALMFLAIAAAMMVSICRIENVVFSAVMGALMGSFPVIMCIFMYDIKVYLWVICLAVLCVYIQDRWSGYLGGVISTILLVLTLGAYPPYLTIVASGYLLLLIHKTLFSDENAAKIFAYAVRLLVQLLLGICGYYLILQGVLNSRNEQLGNYMNVDKMTHIDLKKLPNYICMAYEEVWNFFAKATRFTKLCYFGMLVMLIICIVYLVYQKRLYHAPAKMGLFVLFIVLFPLAMHITKVIEQGAHVHMLMEYAFVLFPVVTVKAVHDCYSFFRQNTAEGATSVLFQRVMAVHQWGALLLFVVMIYQWSLTCNEGYLRAEISYEKDYAMLTKIVDDLYESGSFYEDQVILFTYSVPDENGRRVQNMTKDPLQQYDRYTGVPGGGFMLGYDGVLERYVSMLLGINFQYADTEMKDALVATEEYAAMPRYPYSGYIQEISGTLVVKITDDSV